RTWSGTAAACPAISTQWSTHATTWPPRSMAGIAAWAGGSWCCRPEGEAPPRYRSSQQALDQREIQPGQRFQVGDRHVFVHLVDARVHRADLDAVRAQRGDEARVGGAAAGALLRRRARMPREHFTRCPAQRSLRGEERLAAGMPVDVEIQLVPAQHRFALALQAGRVPARVVAEVEQDLETARDHVVGA